MEVLLNEYYDNIDDPFATTDIAIEIIEKTVWLIKQNKKQTEQVDVLLGENENHFCNIKSMERRIKKLEKENKRYHEVIVKIKSFPGNESEHSKMADVECAAILEELG